MEWVETTGRSIEEAKERALDQLGVHEEDAEFDVVEEPRPGLFGRMRGEARVRARVRPTQPRPKAERRPRKSKIATPETGTAPESALEPAGDDGDGPEEIEAAKPARQPRAKSPARSAAAAADRPNASTERVTEPGERAPVDEEGRQAERDAAAAFLQGLADALGEAEASTEIVVINDDEAEVRLDGGDLGLFIGPRGQTLIAVQDLTRLVAQRRGADRHGRLRIDIAGYRERRREALARFTEQVADEVRSSGAARALEPMTSMDRKIVHDAANELDGVETISEGEEPFRRVVIRPTVSA